MAKFSSDKHVVKNRHDRPRVLVAPLDWGLGHATRCIPVIYELQKQQADVWLAGERSQEHLLRQEFPGLPFLPLRGYRVRYSKKASGLWRALLRQMPGLWGSVQREKKWLSAMIEQHQFDLVISDNRFGLSHPGVPCVFITHQLTIKTSLGKWLDKQAQRMNYQFIRRFQECWIPDYKTEPNLAGSLAHPIVFPDIPCFYTGILSRLQQNNTPITQRHLFISLSGPEPQRTIWEDRLINDLFNYKGTATVVRGLPDSDRLMPSTNDIRFFNHLGSQAFAEELGKAEWVICRSGYSTVMDLAKMGKKAILVPTPGQPEQEYLAQHLHNNGFAPFISQKDFTLERALSIASDYTYRPFDNNRNTVAEVVEQLVRKVFV
ncbi:glycosyl transferase family 28 [Terrimonas sp. NA20]|uniref:Glycosyl transferase family 28 n=1 Tax=Terrimonas ginsenosidimutans TaxID=2908004 RepID=A0ABS9KUN1_9BACT|nr:glycosyltransferase [Terrimonas ginsenosidimutans]MCG2616054.1 glycosyl transferase family 28 [Terrimonas ginsenosidimutans]